MKQTLKIGDKVKIIETGKTSIITSIYLKQRDEDGKKHTRYELLIDGKYPTFWRRELQLIKPKTKKVKDWVIGWDNGTKDGDIGCKVYGYLDKNGIMKITRVKYLNKATQSQPIKEEFIACPTCGFKGGAHMCGSNRSVYLKQSLFLIQSKGKNLKVKIGL